MQGDRASERRRKEESPPENIYDTPKTTSVKWKEDLAAAYDIVSKGSRNGIVSAVNLQLVPADGEDSEGSLGLLIIWSQVKRGDFSMRMWVLRASNSSAWQIRSPPYSHTLYNRRSMTSQGNHLQFLFFFTQP